MVTDADEKLSILIVEDDLIDRKLLERLLSRSSLSGSLVNCVDRLASALECLRQDTYDIVLTDLGLPDCNGTEAVEKIQSVAPNIPLIVLSGLDDESTAINSVKQGVQDYLIKGQVDSQVLVRSIRYAIERKKAERNLHDAEQRYRTIFENSAVAIMMVDDHENLVSWNRFTENLLGYTHSELHNRPIRSIYPEDEWERIRAHNIRRKGMQHHLETRMLKGDGDIIDVDVSLSVLKDSHAKVIGSIGVIRDITERKQAEEELDRSYSLLYATLESTADGILVVDEKGIITSFNQKFADMWEVRNDWLEVNDSAALVETMSTKLINADAFSTTLQNLQHHLEEDHRGTIELTDGRIFEHYSQPRHFGETVHGRVWSFRDITERKRVEEALSKSEERFRQVVENAEEWIWEVDSTGLYTYVSPVVANILGYTPDNMVGSMHFYDHFHPGDRDRLKKKAFEVFVRKDTFREFESKNLDKNDQVVWLSKSGVPILDEQSRLIGYRGVDVDITERRRIHEILHRKQKNLEAIFDAAPVGMLLVDEEVRVRRANDAIRNMAAKDYAQIINQLPGYVLGCKYVAANPADCETRCGTDPECENCALFCTIKQAMDSGLPVHGVEIQPTLQVNGKEIKPSLSISSEPVFIDGAKYAVVSVHDITDRAKAEKELRETMEIKSQFISTVSHELRTPLASMKEAVLIVLDGVAGQINDDQHHFLDVAKRNIERLSRLINDVLDFQKLGSGKMKFILQEHDIAKVVEEAVSTMQPFAGKRDVHLSLHVDDRLPRATFDNDRIIQVLTNLISNAIKFTPADGEVRVVVEKAEDTYRIKICDTGMGIPQEALAKIFDRFYRVHRPGKEIKGTGLGLAIVKRIVDAHGGFIEVESELEKGTTFSLTMPFVQQDDEQDLSPTQDAMMEETIATAL
ncbi:PAS domain S-box protein [Planctomycetota bacterium]